jgi:hypothetical protein
VVRSYGRAVAKIVCASGMTLKCNTQRAHPLGASALTGWVQFDSDYSDGDEASLLFLKVRSLLHYAAPNRHGYC